MNNFHKVLTDYTKQFGKPSMLDVSFGPTSLDRMMSALKSGQRDETLHTSPDVDVVMEETLLQQALRAEPRREDYKTQDEFEEDLAAFKHQVKPLMRRG